MNTSNWLNDAEQHWNGNRGYEAGILICSHLPIPAQPLWAARILRLAVEKSGASIPLLTDVQQVAMTPEKWSSGHRLFSEVRAITLQHDKTSAGTPEDDMLSYLLAVAEQTAKVTYNATSPPDAFDDDSCAWIVAMLRGFVSHCDDDRFDEQAWQAVCNGVDLS